MSRLPTPRRGEVWWFDPNPVRSRELGQKVRPALIVSTDHLARERFGKVVVVPGTSQARPNPLHVPFPHALRGRSRLTYFCCEDVRSIDGTTHLRARMGARLVPESIMRQIEYCLRLLLEL